MEFIKNSLGRVFVSKGITDQFKYYNIMSVGAVDKTMPSQESIFTIDAKGNTIKVGNIVDHDVQPSASSLLGYVPLSSHSNLETLLSKSSVNIQVHFGLCKNPSDFNDFESALILKGVTLTNYGLSEPSTLSPNRTMLQESANITIDKSYRIFTPTFDSVYGIATMLGIGYANSNYCTIANPNQDILIATLSASSFLRFIYSFDNGKSWQMHSTLFSDQTGSPVTTSFEIVKDKIYWSIVNGTQTYIYSIDVDSIINDIPSLSTRVFAHGNYAAIRDMVATSSYLWCVGGSGASFAVRVSLANNIAEILDDDNNFAGMSANAVDALNDNFVVIVGEDDNVAIYRDGTFFLTTIGIDSSAFLSDVKVFSENHWCVCSDMGIYITTNGGISWKKTLPVQSKCKFAFYDDLVGYAANTDGVYRTVDGGNTWFKIVTSLWSNINRAIIDSRNPNNIFFLESNHIYSSL